MRALAVCFDGAGKRPLNQYEDRPFIHSSYTYTYTYSPIALAISCAHALARLHSFLLDYAIISHFTHTHRFTEPRASKRSRRQGKRTFHNNSQDGARQWKPLYETPFTSVTGQLNTAAYHRNTDKMARQVQPLRISKSTPTASPDKQVAMSRPLAEISSGSTRRNSPSYNQSTRVSPLIRLSNAIMLILFLPETAPCARALSVQRERFSFTDRSEAFASRLLVITPAIVA